MSKILRLWGCYACRKIFPEHRSVDTSGRSKLPLCPNCKSSAVTRQLDWLIDRDSEKSAVRGRGMGVVSFPQRLKRELD